MNREGTRYKEGTICQWSFQPRNFLPGRISLNIFLNMPMSVLNTAVMINNALCRAPSLLQGYRRISLLGFFFGPMIAFSMWDPRNSQLPISSWILNGTWSCRRQSHPEVCGVVLGAFQARSGSWGVCWIPWFRSGRWFSTQEHGHGAELGSDGGLAPLDHESSTAELHCQSRAFGDWGKAASFSI